MKNLAIATLVFFAFICAGKVQIFGQLLAFANKRDSIRTARESFLIARGNALLVCKS